MKKTAALLMPLLFTLPVVADPVDLEQDGSVEVLLGSASKSVALKNYPTVSASDLSAAVRMAVFLGKYVAVEVGYHELGESEVSNVGPGFVYTDVLSGTEIRAGVKLRFQVSNSTLMGVRAGMAKWQLGVEHSDTHFPGQSILEGDSSADLYYGAYIQQYIGHHFFIGLEYDGSRKDVSMVGTSATYQVNNTALAFGASF